MGKVLYLTGAPATGKSSLCANLISEVPSTLVYSYSALLRDHINLRLSLAIDENGIRTQSANIVRREDVEAVDKKLIEEVTRLRQSHNIIIDSHAVTKEVYGFRVTPFTFKQLQQLNPDSVVCLYANPATIAERILNDPAGRPLPSEFELSMHIQLQATLAAEYAFLLACNFFLIDSNVDTTILQNTVRTLVQL